MRASVTRIKYEAKQRVAWCFLTRAGLQPCTILTRSRRPVMATLGQLVANSLWFAFDALDHQKTGAVPKSQLKVRQPQGAGVVGVTPPRLTGVGGRSRAPRTFYRRDLLTLAPLVSYSLDPRGLPFLKGGPESLPRAVLLPVIPECLSEPVS